MNTNSDVRHAYQAGRFYPATENEIQDLLLQISRKEKENLDFEPEGKNIIGGILPHAGHVYSGYQTVGFFEVLRQTQQDFESFVILHPLHRGGSLDYASDENKYWSTPLGNIALDEEFINAMELKRSAKALDYEHSAEVLLPYLQFFGMGNKKIIPIGIGWQHPESSKEIAHKIFKAVQQTERKICILASSDFSHFVDPEEGEKLDQKALDQILAFDPENLYSTITSNNISICGYGPIMSLMYYCSFQNGKAKVEILSRGHSGMVSPSSEVVDYISLVFYTKKE
jgi:hypothetical protein